MAVATNRASHGFRAALDVVMELLTRTETTLTEFVSSTTLLYAGFVLLLPGEALIPGSGLYSQMKLLMSENWWGVLFMAVGLFQSIANLRRDKTLRRTAAAVSAILFGYIGALGFHATPVSVFGAVCKVHCLGQMIAFWHLGYHIDREARGAQ